MPPSLAGFRVLQVVPALDAGGVERGTIEIARAIVEAGGKALVASAGGRLVPSLERTGARHIGLPLLTKDPLNLWRNAGKLARLIREERVSLVHARSRAPAWSAYLAARREAVPFVTTWHGLYGEDFPGKRLYNGVMARGDRVIAISRFVADRILTRHRIDPARLRVIPRGVDTALFDPDRITGDRVHRLEQAWRLPPNARVILLPGRLTRWKGASLLLDAVSRLRGSENLFVVLAGDVRHGRFAADLEQQARRLGLAPRLRLAGHVEDMPAALALAELAVCPSLKPEPFGRAVIEAQAMARPVIAAAGGGAAETIVHDETGWRFPAGDALALAGLIDHVLAMSAEARGEIGRAARASVSAHATLTAMQNATLDVYRELL